MKKIWVEIPGFENYEISNFGKIKSKARIVTRGKQLCSLKECIKKIKIEKNGYMVVQLFYAPKLGKTKTIHRLLAESFIPNPDNKPCVNHKNGIKTDNRLENLEWCTYSENSSHAIDNQLSVPAKGKDHYAAYLSEKDVLTIKKFRKDNITQKKIAELFNTTRENVRAIVNGKTWKHLA